MANLPEKFVCAFSRDSATAQPDKLSNPDQWHVTIRAKAKLDVVSTEALLLTVDPHGVQMAESEDMEG
jgi:hypothetical protein